MRWRGSLAVQPVTGRVLLHALSFSGKAVHLAVDSVSDSRLAAGRRGPGHPPPDVARAGAKLRAVASGSRAGPPGADGLITGLSGA